MVYRSLTGLPSLEEVRVAAQDVAQAMPGGRQMLRMRLPFSERLILCADETANPTNNFKYRSAISVIRSAQRLGDKKLVAVTSGNFGFALAQAAQDLAGSVGDPVEVLLVLPASSPPAKVDPLRKLGAEVIQVDGEFDDAVRHAHGVAREQGIRLVSPDNDRFVIAGAASLAVDLFLGGLPAKDNVLNIFSPYVGGGSFAGLIKGWEAAVLLAPSISPSPIVPAVNFIAVTYAENEGHWPAALGDRTILRDPAGRPGLSVFAGDVEEGSPAFNAVGAAYELTCGVGAKSIDDGMLAAWQHLHLNVEATAGATLAAALRHAMPVGTNVAILAGGNVEPAEFARALESAGNRVQAGQNPDWWDADRLHSERTGATLGIREAIHVGRHHEHPEDPLQTLRASGNFPRRPEDFLLQSAAQDWSVLRP
jgi:threonine dehydratase